MENPVGPRSTRTEPLEGSKMYKSVKLPPPLAPYKMSRLCAWIGVAATRRANVAGRTQRIALFIGPSYQFPALVVKANSRSPFAIWPLPIEYVRPASPASAEAGHH